MNLKRLLTVLAALAAGCLVYLLCRVGKVRQTELTFSWVALGLYVLAFSDYLVAFLKRRRGRSEPGDILLATGIIAHLIAVIIRGRVAGHLPFASRFEALLFYSFVSAALTFLLSTLRRNLPVAFLSLPIVIVYLLGSLLGSGKEPSELMPVLNSPFFLVHVVVAFLGYAFYTLNLGLAAGALFSGSSPGPDASTSRPSRLGSTEALIGLARRLVPFGLLFLGTGIGLGGIWAMFSWGAWWGWDPKETGALVTWLSYVVYTHAPVWKGVPRKVEAVFLIIGYLLLLLTFLGVNLLKWGLHAYQ